MTFFTSTSTPLFSMTWTPKTTGQYAGTCIFLIVISLIFRAIIALRSYMEASTWSRSPLSSVPEAYKSFPKSAEDGDGCAVDTQARATVQPWRVGVEGSRAVLDVMIVGVGYLLMIAVMTMNVGYFLSVLGGTFVGSFLFARFAAARVCR
ncbi:Ctr copper transporter [Delphinella strobiligena]|nr:Ctr copper transporter [Delphinella strobiligena]